MDAALPQRPHLGRLNAFRAARAKSACFARRIAMKSLTSLVFAFAGMGLFTFGLLWSMYGVMDNY